MLEIFKNVEIEINTNCNRKCRYCPNSVCKNLNEIYMKKEVFEEIIDQLYDISFKGRISYHFYNEPLLHRDVAEFVKYVKNKLPYCKQVLYTNGDKLTYEMFSVLKNNGIDLIVVTNHNSAINKKKHAFYSVYSDLNENEKEIVVYIDSDDLNLTNRGGSIGEGIESVKHVPCYITSSLIVVDVSGNIIACYEDYERRMVMGNLMNKNIIEIWKTKEYVDLRKKLINGERNIYEVCNKCNNFTITNKAMEYEYIL